MSIRINVDFPGGSVVVRAYRDKQVLLRQDTWGSSIKFLYFYFEAESDDSDWYDFDFVSGNSISSGGVAYSLDQGVTWEHLPFGAGSCRTGFRYFMRKNQPVRFCLGQQFLQADLERFLAETPAIRREVLCRSIGKREVELLRIGSDAPDRIPVLLTARHHACEMHGTQVMMGLLAAAAADPDFQKKYNVYAVPFVDKDGVEEGLQGKARIPHDHNRDYGDPSIYPEVRALKALDQEKHFQIVLDFHCPRLFREKIFFFGSEHPRIERNIEELCDLLGLYGPAWLNFNRDDLIKFGYGHNRPYRDGISCARYFAAQPWAKLSATNEISYDFANKNLLTVAKLREYGKGIADAMKHLTLQ